MGTRRLYGTDTSNSGKTLGWQGYVAVDGEVFNWLGAAPGPGPADQIAAEYTSTKSIFTFDVAGKVNLTVTFLSPIYPDDLAKQAQQLGYLTVAANSRDGKEHSVQVYTDVSGGELTFYGGVSIALRKCSGELMKLLRMG